jgi:hypothetical protein
MKGAFSPEKLKFSENETPNHNQNNILENKEKAWTLFTNWL